jgi:hypothetical protein
MPAKFQLEKASVLSLAGWMEFREAEDHLAKKAPARGLESAEAVGRNTNGATLARSLFTKRDLLD